MKVQIFISRYLTPVLLLMMMFSAQQQLEAHPWGGLVIDEEGNIYFTFICPFTDDDHYACVWQLSDDALTPTLESRQSPSDIILARNNNRIVFGAERTNAGQGFQARLWQLNQHTWHDFISPTTRPENFHIQTYAVDNAGAVYFARENQLFKRASDGTVEQINITLPIERIDLMAWGADETLYLVDRGTLLKIEPETGDAMRIATGLRSEDPEDLPFSGANILFDMAIDSDGTAYLAYYGNRRILKVSPSGAVSTFARSEAPWSPHGIDIFNGEIYILESTVGAGKWWKPWGRPMIVPRIRKISPDGNAAILFEHKED